MEVAATASGLEEDQVKNALSLDGLLVVSGIFMPSTFPPPVAVLSGNIVSFLDGMVPSHMCLRFVTTRDGPVVPMEQFEVVDQQKQLLQDILIAAAPAHVLIRGAPGTGKTEFVRSILHSAGRRAFFLPFSRRETDECIEERHTRLSIAAKAVGCAGGSS